MTEEIQIGGLEGFIRSHNKTITLFLIILVIGVMVWAGWEAAQQFVACNAISERLTRGNIDACTACDMAEQLGIIRSNAPTTIRP